MKIELITANGGVYVTVDGCSDESDGRYVYSTVEDACRIIIQFAHAEESACAQDAQKEVQKIMESGK